MKFEEMLIELRHGKKARLPDWDDNCYYGILDNQLMFFKRKCEPGQEILNYEDEIDSDELFRDDWEVVE